MKEITDESLVLAARSGDVQAFDELVRRHYAAVFRRVKRILGNRDDAQDVAQDVFVKAYRSLEQIRDGTTIRAWLGMIGVRLALNRARRDRFRKMLSLISGDVEEPAATGADALHRVEEKDAAFKVEIALRGLSPAQRTAFCLRHFEQMPFGEVAACMRNSESTARVLYFQAVRRLRAAVEEES